MKKILPVAPEIFPVPRKVTAQDDCISVGFGKFVSTDACVGLEFEVLYRHRG